MRALLAGVLGPISLGASGAADTLGAGPKIAPNRWPYAAFVQPTRKPRQALARSSL